MAGPSIRLGDETWHGGTVVEASQHGDTGGAGIARMGDKATCALHGNTAITSGDGTLIVDGKPAARHGDRTACDAVLIAGPQATIDNI